MDWTIDPSNWTAMEWEMASKTLQEQGADSPAFDAVYNFAQKMGIPMENNPREDAILLAQSQQKQLTPDTSPLSTLKNLFRNPNKNPYPGRTAPGGSAGEIFGNAMEQR
jgi:hypothetical protein